MINPKTNQRELAYAVRITDVRDIEGVNNQVAVVNGWTVFIKRDEFKPGDLAIYFEIDSKVPEKPCFEFLRKYNFKVKTQKFVKGLVISQGLVIKPEELGLKNVEEGEFLTEKLGVVYYEAEDNKRKADNTKYTSMQARHKKFFKTKFGKWLMAREWGRKLCFFFLGKKKDKKSDWPTWVVKTDEERIQNIPSIYTQEVGSSWIATEKIDGSSTTFTMKQDKPKKRKLLVCSRNVVFDSPKKEDKNYYKEICGNIWLEMADKYDMEGVLNDVLNKHPNWEFITIQGETFGAGVQKRDYGMKDRDFRVFNIIYKENGKAPVRMSTLDMSYFLALHSGMKCLKTVPILTDNFIIPDSCEKIIAAAAGLSKLDGKSREGIVFRTRDGERSFKAVDPEFLMKYHN